MAQRDTAFCLMAFPRRHDLFSGQPPALRIFAARRLHFGFAQRYPVPRATRRRIYMQDMQVYIDINIAKSAQIRRRRLHGMARAAKAA